MIAEAILLREPHGTAHVGVIPSSLTVKLSAIRAGNGGADRRTEWRARRSRAERPRFDLDQTQKEA
jgi:hypothetical protein